MPACSTRALVWWRCLRTVMCDVCAGRRGVVGKGLESATSLLDCAIMHQGAPAALGTSPRTALLRVRAEDPQHHPCMLTYILSKCDVYWDSGYVDREPPSLPLTALHCTALPSIPKRLPPHPSQGITMRRPKP